MSYAEELLALAMYQKELTTQAEILRKISTAYYAVFHLLTAEACSRLVGDSPARKGLRTTLRRAFGHLEMRDAAKGFARANPSPKLGFALPTEPIAPELRFVAETFIELRELRHEADYDLRKGVTAADAQRAGGLSLGVFVEWARIRDTEAAQVFLVSLLLLKSIRQ